MAVISNSGTLDVNLCSGCDWKMFRVGVSVTGARMVVDLVVFFFFNDTATTEIYTLSLHDALPI